MKKRYYIAYGSNLNVRQMLQRCPTARILGTANLDGWQLLFRGSKTGSYLTIEKRKGSTAPVAVWEITEDDERSLDHYEGYPNFYYKQELTVSFQGIKTGKTYTHKAMVYIMHEDRPLGLPSQYYVDVCAEGYRYFGFNIDYLVDAINKSKTEERK